MIKRGYFKDFVFFFCLKFFKVWDLNDKESFYFICLEVYVEVRQIFEVENFGFVVCYISYYIVYIVFVYYSFVILYKF